MDRRDIEMLIVQKLQRYFYCVLSGQEIAYIWSHYAIPVSRVHLKEKFLYYAKENCNWWKLMADQEYLMKIFIDRANVLYDDKLKETQKRASSDKYIQDFNNTKAF